MTATEEMLARRERWAEALESGQYVQTKGRLHDDNGFCCLGVACDLYGVEWKRTPVGFGVPIADGEDRLTTLPDEVMAWLGMSGYVGAWLDDNGRCESLTDKNDQGATFAEIAAIIRAAPEGLFDD